MTTNRLVQLMVAISVIIEEIFEFFRPQDPPSESDNADTTQDTQLLKPITPKPPESQVEQLLFIQTF